jgi:hypothetical protein
MNKMDTIKLKIEGHENVTFFISLIQRFNFIKEISVNKGKSIQNKGIEEAPIEWAEMSPSIDDFTGIWDDRTITLNDIRNKGWKRN